MERLREGVLIVMDSARVLSRRACHARFSLGFGLSFEPQKGTQGTQSRMGSEPRQLSKDIGASQFFTLAFGSIIGVGWVVALSSWLSQAGPLGAVLGFVGGGVLMMLIGLCYVEISTMFPVSGGEVVYTYEIFGTGTSFAVGWLFALAYIAIAAFE